MRAAAPFPLRRLGLTLGLRQGSRSLVIAATLGAGFGLFMALADATLLHAAIPDSQRILARDWSMAARLIRFLQGALLDEVVLRLVGMSTLVALLARMSRQSRVVSHDLAIALTALGLWPLYAHAYLAHLPLTGLTMLREAVLHGGAGMVWGWLYSRHGWLAGLVGHGSCHLALQPLLIFTV